MNDRDRLAADLAALHSDLTPYEAEFIADALLDLGWTRLDEERLARAYHLVALTINGDDPIDIEPSMCQHIAAAIAKAYREDTDA